MAIRRKAIPLQVEAIEASPLRPRWEQRVSFWLWQARQCTTIFNPITH